MSRRHGVAVINYKAEPWNTGFDCRVELKFDDRQFAPVWNVAVSPPQQQDEIACFLDLRQASVEKRLAFMRQRIRIEHFIVVFGSFRKCANCGDRSLTMFVEV